jgi:hypothetical protein
MHTITYVTESTQESSRYIQIAIVLASSDAIYITVTTIYVDSFNQEFLMFHRIEYNSPTAHSIENVNTSVLSIQT